MMSSSYLKCVIKISLVLIHLAAGFNNIICHGQRKSSGLQLSTHISMSAAAVNKLPIATSIMKSVGNEFGRTLSILCNASIERKAVVFAHPLMVVLLCLIAGSKFGRNLTKSITGTIINFRKSMTKNGEKASALALSFAKAKLVTSTTTLVDNRTKIVKKVAAIINSEKRAIIAPENAVSSKLKSKRTEDLAATAAIKLSIANVESLEIAYAQAQKLKRETAKKESLAKAQAIEVEATRVTRISKCTREMDDFRKIHDIQYRRWTREQSPSFKISVEAGSSSQVEHAAQIVEKQVIHELPAPVVSNILLAEIAAVKVAEQIAAAKMGEMRKAADILVERAEEAKRQVAKAAVEKANKDAEIAYAAQLRLKATIALVRYGYQSVSHSILTIVYSTSIVNSF